MAAEEKLDNGDYQPADNGQQGNNIISDANETVDDLKTVDKTFNKGRGEKYVRDKLGLNKNEPQGTETNPEGNQPQAEPPAEAEPPNQVNDVQGSDTESAPEPDQTTDAPQTQGQEAPEGPTSGESTGEPIANLDSTVTDAGDDMAQAGENTADASSKAANAGSKAVQGGEKAADATSKVAGAGEKAADATSKVANAGEKAADVAGKAANVGSKAVQGAEVAAEGAAAAAEGASLAAAPETLGASLLVGAAIEGAKQAPKVAKKAIEIAKKGVEIKEGVEAAGRLSKKGLKIVGCCILIAIIPFVYTIYVIEKLYELNPLNLAAKAVKALFGHRTASGALAFDDPASQAAIDGNQVSEGALRIMTDLSKEYKVTIHYKGSPSPATGKENEPYEFDLISVDEIKCTDTANNKKIEPPIKINLEYDFSWPSLIAPGTENYVCGVGYYPKFDSPPVTIASSLYGPTEFILGEIATYGPQAAQQKIYESAELIMRKSAENENKEGDFPVSRILIPPVFYNSNLKTGQAGLGETLKRRAKEIFPDRSSDEIIKSDTNTKGVHIGFD